MEQITDRKNKAAQRFADYAEYVDSLNIDEAEKSTLKYLCRELAVHAAVDISASTRMIVSDYKQAFPEAE